MSTTQLTLVSHYGAKPPAAAKVIGDLQKLLIESLGTGFCPYRTEQVHGTIAGLEGVRVGDGICNENFRRHRHEARPMIFERLLMFLRSLAANLTIQIGGFDAEHDYRFTSQGRHPSVRSFSIQGETAVAMGWPFENGGFPARLDQLRRELQRFGILHKWHQREENVDNDFFFVLGHVARSITSEQRATAEQRVRDYMAGMPPLLLPITRETLSFVAYIDTQLPPESSRVLKLSDRSVTADTLASIYG